MMLMLVPIEENTDISKITEEPAKTNVAMTLEFYKSIGFERPWISYLVKQQDTYVGICAFKGKPVNNNVEIAYSTFPQYEGRGIATEACKMLVAVAQNENPGLIISARTLPEENASTNILKKNNFVLAGKVVDPEDGEVFEWRLSEPSSTF